MNQPGHQVPNPYPGPRPFTRAEQALFYGREQEARDLLSLVISERLVFFYAQSGAGKSSLVNAALIPGLEKTQGFEVLPVARVGGQAPSEKEVRNVFVYNLLLSLDESEQQEADLADMSLGRFLNYLAKIDDRYTYDERYYETAAPGDIRPRILIIDQFEEIVTTHPEHWRQREDFFVQLAEAMRADRSLGVLLCMREDYIAQLDPYAHLLPDMLRTRFYMQPMGFEAALKAVKEPVREIRPFARDVAEDLVDNLRQVRVMGPGEQQVSAEGEFVEPVQLQVVCLQLWENLKGTVGNEISRADLDRLAGGENWTPFVDNALAQFYNQAIADVAREDVPGQTTYDLRAWFEDKLITENRTRAAVNQGADTGGLHNSLVRKLERRFLLRSDSRAGSRWYELVHDRFIDPILQANAKWRREHPLIRDARNWLDAKRPNDLLYQGDRLSRAFEDADARAIRLVQEFLEAGRRVETEAAKTRELEIRAEEERLRADQQATARKRLQWLALVLLAVGLLAIGAAAFARRQRGAAVNAREQAERQADIAQSGKLAAHSIASLDSDPQLGLLLAVEAIRVAHTSQAEDALRRALSASSARTILRGHASRVNQVAISPDGRTVATGDGEGIVRLWTIRDGTERNSLAEHEDALVLVAFDPPGEHLVTVGADGRALLWDVERAMRRSGQFIELEEYAAQVNAAALSGDGRWLIAGSVDDTARVWDLEDPVAEPVRLSGHIGSVHAVALSADGVWAATAGLDGSARLWDGRTGESAFAMPHGSTVNALAFSPDSAMLATTSAAGTVRLWDTASGAERVLGRYKASVDFVAFSPDGSWLATADSEGTARVWEVARDEPVLSLEGHRDRITALAFGPKGRSLATASADSTARLWNIPSGDLQTILEGHTSSINALAFAPDGTLLATASSDSTARLWATAATGPQTVLHRHKSPVVDVAFHADGDLLASRSEEGIIQLWDVATAPDVGVQVRPATVLSGTSASSWTEMAFSPAGDLLAEAGLDDRGENGVLQLWDLSTPLSAQAVISRTIPERIITSVAFAQDGRLLATSDTDPEFEERSTVRLWQLDGTLEPIAELTPRRAEIVVGLAFRPQSNLLAISESDYKVRLGEITLGAISFWDTSALSGPARGPTRGNLLRANAGLVSLGFSPDGEMLATGGADSVVRLWDLSTAFGLGARDAKPIPLRGHERWVVDVAFGPDGRLLATASRDGTARLWDVPMALDTGGSDAEVAVLSGHKGAVRSVAFHPDGRVLVSGGEDGTVRLWTVWAEDLQAQACELVVRNLTQAERATYFGRDREYRKTCPNRPVDPSAIQAELELVKEHVRQGQIPEAQRVVRRALELDPALKLVPEKEVAEALVEWGDILAREGRVQEALKAVRQALELDPTVATTPEKAVSEMLVARGEEYARQGRAQDALEALRQAIELDPALEVVPEQAVAETLVERGRITARRGRIRNALQALRQALELDPALEVVPEQVVAEALVERGQNYARRGSEQRALEALRQALELDPALDLAPAKVVAEAFVERGQQYASEGAYEESLAALRRALELDPALDLVPEAIVAEARGRAYALQGQTGQALEALRQALALDPSLEVVPEQIVAEALVERGRDAAYRGRDQEALIVLRRALELDPSLDLAPEQVVAEALVERGESAARAGRDRDALEALRRALELDPALELVPEAVVAKAQGLEHARRGQIEEALVDLRRAIELDPTLGLAPEQIVAEALVERGQDYARKGGVEEALSALRRALELDPTLGLVPEQVVAEALVERGQDYARRGSEQQALEALRQALELAPSLNLVPEQIVAEALVMRGKSSARGGRKDQALRDLRRALELDPTLELVPEAVVAETQGLEYARQGQTEEALVALRRALELDPSLGLAPEQVVAEALVERGQNYARRGRIEEALVALRRALELAPSLDLVPEQVVAEELVSWGAYAARRGRIEEALEALRQALELDPTLELVPEAVVAEAQAQQHVRQGQTEEALKALRQALELDPSLDLVPEQVVAEELVSWGAYAARRGRIEEALEALRQALELDPQIESRQREALANAYDAICWRGSLSDQAEQVLPACERAVELAPGDGDVHDNRGLARALTGDTEGAIEDFWFAIRYWRERGVYKLGVPERREMWIAELKAGRNPFDSATLEALRRE